MPESKYGKYIVTELKTDFSKEFNEQYAKLANRVLWIDDKVVQGAFQMNTSWYFKPQPADQPLEAHIHDADEIIGFFGNNHDNPHDLGGEVEFWMEDEKHIITKSCLIFVPGGMKHCPLILRRVDRPIFHFSVVTSRKYILKEAKD
jgi:hypothetical protein